MFEEGFLCFYFSLDPANYLTRPDAMKKTKVTKSDSLGWNGTTFLGFFFSPLIEAGENLSEKVMFEFRLQ